MLGFELPCSVDDVDRACDEVVRANGIVDGYVRPIAWRGSEMMGVSAQGTSIHLAIAAWDWGSYFNEEARLEGIRMRTSPWRRPSPQCAPVHAKATGLYMICTLSKHQAESEGYHDALMLDWRGQVAEGTGANIFLAMPDGRLHTPTPDCFLDGITRRTVIGLARARGIEVVERAIMPDGAGAGARGVPHRHRRRGDAGRPDRRPPLRAGRDHPNADPRLPAGDRPAATRGDGSGLTSTGHALSPPADTVGTRRVLAR